MKTYTELQIKFIIGLKIQGYAFKEIARKYNSKFKQNKSQKSIERCYERNSKKEDIKQLKTFYQRREESLKERLIENFINAVKDLKKIPSIKELKSYEITKEKIYKYFGSLEQLQEIARELKPEVFKDIVDEYLFTKERYESLLKAVKKHKRFIITTAITGDALDDKFFKAVKTYCKYNKALSLFQPCSDPAKISEFSKWSLDSKLINEYIVFKDTWLNSNVLLSTIKLSAKQILPLTGLKRFAQKGGAFIYASPKQFLETVPVGDNTKPKVIITPGAITTPNYRNQKYMSERTAYISNQDHTMGAIIVEIQDDKTFFVRNIQKNKDGSFNDLDKRYLPNGKVVRAKTSLVALGDYHAAEVDKKAKECARDIVNLTQPEFLTVEDFFNGTSINPHESHKSVSLAKRAQAGKLSLEEELKRDIKELKDICGWKAKNVVFKRGNHEEFLSRYIQDDTFIKDPHNYYVGLKVAVAMCEGKEAYEYAITDFLNFKHKKVRFLKKGELFKVDGVENSIHGNLGPNGKKGASLKSLDESFGKANTGHSHSPAIFRDIVRNGTLSTLKPDYCDGPSSWAHSVIIQHVEGTRQLILILNGKYKLK